jgi:AbrB family looped-hinge helix DNA binding protein
MKATIDGAGRLVIPSEIRRAAGLVAGSELEVRLRGGVVELEPASASVRLVKRGSLTVAAGDEARPPLSEETVRDTVDSLRQSS